MSLALLSINRDGDQVVRRPRAGDALGAALRNAFGYPGLPDDMRRLLRKLDKA